ncbi:hypothetical protein FisN_21Hh205 [Fistulifera solaris]|uniref:Ribosome-associated protein n=1 Tax=Fistulifera solaris TaxID=1519565 RepID=A0A1Z5JSK6_FISSO|nr:hypothetical protein FisN_21Hh205 [Fistulifera solaris]|eukprot:GAX16758.1 hypothetical protein FisN_21Hh205 [Fistulifera solaris]
MRYSVLLQLVFLYASDEVEAWSLADRLTGRVPSSSRNGHRSHNYPRYGKVDDGNSELQSTSTKHDKREMIDFIQEPMSSTVGDDKYSINTDETLLPLLECIVKAADGRKAEDIVALQVNHVSTLTSVLVIVSGNSRPQNQAIAAAITRDVQDELGQRPGGNGVPEGSAESGWILLDYGSVMVHIMTPKSRLYYNVEGQWKEKGGVATNIDYLLIPNQVVGRRDDAKMEPAPEDDPFWS